jgi:hypothetical protein
MFRISKILFIQLYSYIMSTLDDEEIEFDRKIKEVSDRFYNIFHTMDKHTTRTDMFIKVSIFKLFISSLKVYFIAHTVCLK